MTALQSHLEQITLSATAISELVFPEPKIFTNALLKDNDITNLIRDTEVHERALFSVPANPAQLTAQNPLAGSSRRKTTYSTTPGSTEDAVLSASAAQSRGRKNMAVKAVLGGEFVERIRKLDASGPERGDVDVNVLLDGAEKLCNVYYMKGALDRISQLRTRYQRLESSISYHEQRVEKQSAQLSQLNKPKADQEDGTEPEEESSESEGYEEYEEITEADLRSLEEETRQLERKKRLLEERERGMAKDLEGLMR